ncbi:MAG: hypothetical protein JO023_26565 [Chloroflexi bacterium]|nr:hypothetical protein [Chloroflexota bacterium]
MTRLLMALALAVAMVPTAATSEASDGVWTAGANASGDNTYVGFVDQPTTGAAVPVGAALRVSGWVVDTTAQGWSGIDQVQIANGSLDQGGSVLATATIGQNRPDVAATLGSPSATASGFSAIVPAGTFTPGSATLVVYAHTPNKGWWYQEVPIDAVGGGAASKKQGLVATVTQPTADQPIASTRTYTLRGTAYDTDASSGSGVDRVEVYLDGTRGSDAAHGLGQAALDGTNWSLDFSPQQWATSAVEHRRLFVYAHSAVTGQEQMTTSDFLIDPWLTE